ncbi:MAG: hypothetical protein EZS26_002935 [Candidatus Ordinivivax streblomastigis]|uniref:Uncharacterized protein n=1 Tax=Candidatus Ordinivivax streblomastigis TaxID=2540710 RepID=A0A5M8NYL6_9BACT|nr:MAG: hypothetical protein EZS26_002935 [Candidatus Ordinivivax streblomastigis]
MITKPNGSMAAIASKSAATAIKSAKQTWELLGNDVVHIHVESSFPQTYGIGDKITVFGRAYQLNRLPKIRKTGMHAFSYDLEFEGVQYDLIRVTYDLTIDTTHSQLQDIQADALTGDLRRFATVLIANANRVFPNNYVLGDCPETTGDKTLTFGESDNCLSVLQKLCSEFGTEFEIEPTGDVNIIHFKKAGQIFPYTFEYGKGKGLYSLNRQNVDASNIITRLKVFGASKNITNKYRAQRLCLPGCTKGQSYIEKPDAVAKYGIWETVKYFEDIFPSRTGKITALGDSVLKFVDADMFDLNELEADGKTTKYLLPGVSAKVHFNTGNLAGYEFDVHAYDHAIHTFTLVKITDERGDVFPSESSPAFQFTTGDAYRLLDIALPPEYETEAENRLAGEGEIYYDQNSQPKVQYGLSIAKDYLKKLADEGTTVNIFAPGDYIPIKDADIDVDKSVRIQSLTRNLLDEYDYSLTISDTVSTSITNRVVSELIDMDKVIAIHNLRDPAQAQANWRSSREVLNMVFDPEGDYYAGKIKPESIDTIALSVGAKSMQFGLRNTVLQPNYNGDKNVIKVTGGVLTHYTIDENSARSWVLADNTTAFASDSQAYYIYAKCQRAGTAGSILFSIDPIRVEQDAGFYHFWIGVVNSVDAELHARSVALSYGFTLINGRFIQTGRIESSGSGDTYFDLDTGEIAGKILFKSGSSGYDHIADKPDLSPYDEAKAVTDNFTTIDGGLILTSLIKMQANGLQILGYQGDWALQADGYYRSPELQLGEITRISIYFRTTKPNDTLAIDLKVSSKVGWGFGFIGQLDQVGSEVFESFYAVSGEETHTVSVPVPNAGNHSIEVGYEKENADKVGDDCTRFKVILAESGGLSANLDNILLYGGGTYAEAVANTAKIVLRHDGSGQLLGGLFKFTPDNKLIVDLSNFKIDENGNVNITGTFESIAPDGSTTYMQSGELGGIIVRDAIGRSAISLYHYPTGGNSGFGRLLLDNFGESGNRVSRSNLGSGSIDLTNSNGKGFHAVASDTYVRVILDNLPTTQPTTTGQVWNDNGTLKIKI